MSREPNHPDAAPSPEQLAAFLDGELDPAIRPRVEAWLATDPTAAAEIDGQRRVARLWQATPPPEPSAAAWQATFASIEAKCSWSRRRRMPPRTLWLGVGAAAAVLAVVVLGRLLFHPIESGKIVPPPVVNAAPAEQEILLASQDDVSIMNIEPFSQDDGMVATIGEGEVPMIVAPGFAHAGGREP